MSEDDKKPRKERDETDESLSVERKETDQTIARRRRRMESNADRLVERARDQADAVLGSARERADSKLEQTDPASETREVVRQERVVEDAAIEEQRTAEDEGLRREREELARALAALLPLERERTDRHLLTERARSDDALANRDDFMGMVSHDLRNLLSSIVLNASLLARKASETEEGRRTVVAMDRINRYVARMNRLIGDLIDVVSIDAGKLAVQSRSADAAVLLAEAAEAFTPAATEREVTLRWDVATRPLEAQFDHERMLQVLANLITNALKFTPAGGEVTLHGERDGDQLHVTVRDTGVGIAADMLEAVFDRFWQVGKNDQRGLGLGLYISRCIVDVHGGKIWAESEPGGGSVFHFTIPVVAAAQEA